MYDTLQKSGELPAEKLQYFDQEEGAAMLYHMRFLPVTARAATAAYIVDNQLDARVRNNTPLIQVYLGCIFGRQTTFLGGRSLFAEHHSNYKCENLAWQQLGSLNFHHRTQILQLF